jgi:hypothetical protein
MQLSFGFEPGEAPELSAVLAAARRTAVYGSLMARAGSFSQLPPIGIHAYLEGRERFRNPKAAAAKARPEHGEPGAICGSLEELLRLAARVESGKAAPPATVRRLTVRTPLGERLASERARDSLWRAFELPVFEELTGSEGEVLAAECEAHSGLHLDTGSAIFEACYGELVVTSLVALRYPIIRLRTGWVGAIERRACPCGERVTRFVPVPVATGAVRKPPASAGTPRRVETPAVAAV